MAATSGQSSSAAAAAAVAKIIASVSLCRGPNKLLRATRLSTVGRGSEARGGNQSASSFFLFLFSWGGPFLAHAAGAASIWHTFTEYTSAVITLLNAPCGHRAGQQMLDFTSKIEPARGDRNKNSLLAHITDR